MSTSGSRRCPHSSTSCVPPIPDLRIHGLNNTLANDDISTLVNDDLDNSLRITIPLTFVILLVAFGAAVAAFVPLILAVTSLLAAFGVLALYSQFISPVSPYASQLVVLIGLAVAVDYSLFMITRFRTERRRRDKMPAIATASSTAGRAVFFSGLAVMISIGGLFLLDDPLFRSMAIGTISVVFISVVGSLTFLPAILSILDQNVNRFRLPFFGRPREEGSGIWGTVVRATMRHPIPAFVISAGILLALASPVLRLHIGQGDFSSFPDSIEGVQAINLMNEKWPQGSTLQFQVVVTKADEPATKAAIDRLSDELLAIEGLSGPVEVQPSQDGTVALVSYVMSGGQNDIANRQIVRDVRTTVVPRVFGGLPDVQALVTGDAAYTADVVGFYENGMPQVFLFVLGFSFLLLLVAFHSIVIPIKAIILNLLSTGAAYGLLVLVFQEGWGADILNVKPGVIESFVPIFIFTILFGLSMDYHVFILTRIKEATGSRPRYERRRRARHLGHRGNRHERGRDHGRGLRGVRDPPAGDHQAARLRVGRGGLPGRHAHPERAAAGIDAAARGLELVDAGVPVVDPARDDRGRVGRAGDRAGPRPGAGARGRDRVAPKPVGAGLRVLSPGCGRPPRRAGGRTRGPGSRHP